MIETGSLKVFATWARTALIRDVGGRIAGVLAPGSVERVEEPRAVAALEKAVAAAGGGDRGRAGVVDRVAYVWFNRIVALRFMDANGFTGVAVVSPQVGVDVGQPEVLADAKRGVIDTEVVSQETRDTVTGLLAGTRASGDPQGEAYALLLADYCRHWNRIMPFMFEREGDYTELLIPANLLADESVLNRSVRELTAEVCEDVEVIGWLYQFYISERKDEVFAGFKKNQKAGAAEIPAATQLFTPHWIVRYLVENSLGRLWMLNRPSSSLVEQMEYYITPVDEETDFLQISKPEELKVIDPACGSGHMLTYAFDLLYAIYEEEGYAPADIPGLILTNNLYGTEIDPRAGALAAFALTMKARSRQRTFFNKPVAPNICVIEPISFSGDELDFLLTQDGDRDVESNFWNQFTDADTLGALIQPDPEITKRLRTQLTTLTDGGDMFMADSLERAQHVVNQAEFLGPRYSVLVANPPYMGRKNMNSELVTSLRARFETSSADMFSCFMKRSLSFGPPGLQVGMMTPNVWMFLASHESIRREVLASGLTSLVELPLNGFKGATIQICFWTLTTAVNWRGEATFVRLVDLGGDESRLQEGAIFALSDRSSERTFKLRRSDFEGILEGIPGAPLAYWFPDTLFEAFRTSPSLKSAARVAKGLVTADNESFVRQWWEVSRARICFGCPDRSVAKSLDVRWFPYAKGGDFRRWAGNLEAVVNWEQDGHLIQTTLTDDGLRVRATNFNLDRIFKQGIAWTVVTSGEPSFRKVESGYLFDAAAGLCQSTDDEYTLALLNSASAKQVLAGLNPTLNLHPGYLGAVPVPPDLERPLIRTGAARAVELSTRDWNTQERAWGFVSNPLVGRDSSLRASIGLAQKEWNSWVTELQQIENENDLHFARLFGFSGEVAAVPMHRVSLTVNPYFAYGDSADQNALELQRGAVVRDLVSYAVGSIFGRYSLDAGGLVLADQGSTLADYLQRVPVPSFMPDADNVIPIVDGDWFEDDIVARFREFLRVAFGEEHFEENLRFVIESLGVKDLRDYFVKSFYKDHVKRYKKRPIYWLFSSPKGSFNALIYMHRYTPSTVSTVLNEYLREFQAKLNASLENAEGANNPKEADRLRKLILELNDYEHDVLYPLASQNIVIDLDDGVKANYPKFGDALKKIPGLEAKK